MVRRLFSLTLTLVLLSVLARADAPQSAAAQPPTPPAQSDGMVSGPTIHLEGESPANEKANKKGAPKGAKKKGAPAQQGKQAPATQVASAPSK